MARILNEIANRNTQRNLNDITGRNTRRLSIKLPV